MSGVPRALHHRATLISTCYHGRRFPSINRRSIHLSPASLTSKERAVGQPERRAQARRGADSPKREVALDEEAKLRARDVLFPAPIDRAATPSVPIPPLPGQAFLPEEPLGDPRFFDRAWLTPPHWDGFAEQVSQDRIRPISAQPAPNDSPRSSDTSAPRTVADPMEQWEQIVAFLRDQPKSSPADGAAHAATDTVTQLLRSLYDADHLGDTLKQVFGKRYANGTFLIPNPF